MKTTLDLRNDLLARAKALAAQQRTSLTRIIEEGLALRLRPERVRRRVVAPLPMSACAGGFVSGIDAASNQSLYAAADADTGQ